jgi:hypothetical protein
MLLPFLLLLPIGTIGLLWLLIVAYRDRLGLGSLSARGSLVIAFLAFQATVAFISEGSSIGHHFDAVTVTVIWALITLVLLVLALPRLARWHPRRARQQVGERLTTLNVEEWVWLAVVVVSFGILAVIAWLYPPSNADSLVYHLTRVVHWVQDRSVAPFATHYLAQIELSPLHEYNMAHLHLLTGGSDRLDGYVQLAAAATCVVGASEVARLLGGSRRAQFMAAVVCVSIPSLILEATSTQNNDFAGAIGIALLVLILGWRVERAWAVRATALGLGAGLAVLTKGTLPALIAPALLVVAALLVRREVQAGGRAAARRRVAAFIGVAVVAAALVAGPFLLRNFQQFGGPTGPVSGTTINADGNISAGIGNVIRSTAADFWIGNGKTGVQTALSKFVLNTTKHWYAALGVKGSNAKYVLGSNTNAFKVQDWTPYARIEEYGANPWQVLLILFTILMLVVWVALADRSLRLPLVLAAGLVLGYVLLTGAARWSAFNVRYQVPLLVAWSPLIALVLAKLWRPVGIIVLVGLVVAATPALLNNLHRSLLHPAFPFTNRLQPYFLDTGRAGGLKVPSGQYDAALTAVAQSGCNRLGETNWIFVEYPIWAGLRDLHWDGTIEHVDVHNESKQFEKKGFHPCALVSQQDKSYAAADLGSVGLQFGQLALAIDPAYAGKLPTRVPYFSSSLAGVRVLPGGGWTLGNGRPVLGHTASLFVTATATQSVQLRLQARPGVPHLAIAIDAVGVHRTVELMNGEMVANLAVPEGTTRVQLTTMGGFDGGVVPLSTVQLHQPAPTA